ncbi:glutathione-disulfide reductase [Caldimonas brevitalea]|uniref:Glutathione reductase n=1 Tax=Caldimonas brevitalea TaxID=413882 RepID=A0A0G3BUW0_9BURK|nr:glutathione-disulfide reductase [Caldimonas brevitalea]AKJ30290.1 glutathione reductase [Caldimonas brevitalea]
MSDPRFDLFVIGGGSGGVRAARLAAKQGARVALAEAGRLGGTCVNLGCIPKKIYSYAAHHAAAFEEAAALGWHFDTAPQFDWARLQQRRADEVARLNAVYARLLSEAGVTVYPARARVEATQTVRVGEARVHAERVLVAAGSAPYTPELEGAKLAITSNELFDLQPFPSRLVIIGAGYIGCEFASIFSGLGARVTVLYRGDLPLDGFDHDLRRFAAQALAGKGITLRPGTPVGAIERAGGALQVRLANGGEPVPADAVLLATGRRPATAGLGLDTVGVALSETGAVQVDAEFRTSLPWLYAIGDVIGRQALTPVALMQAAALVDRLYGCPGRARREMHEEHEVPTAVFCDPPIGSVGLTEQAARERHDAVAVYRSEFRSLRHAVAGSDERALIKLVVDKTTDRVLGLHMMAPEAPEIVQGFAVALKAGATKALFDSTVAVHPTLAEEVVLMRDEVCKGGSSVA